MNNTCPSPGCGAVYNLTPAHVGRSFTCKKCNAQLTVSAAGLELSGPPQTYAEPLAGLGGTEQRYDEPAPTRRATRVRGGGPNPLSKIIETIIGDPFIPVVGFGLFLMVLFLFMPLIDDANADSKLAKFNRAARKNAKEKDNEKRTKWLAEGEGATLLEDYTEAKDSAKRSVYWYRWGMMVSFFIVGAGGIAWLMHEQLTRRVVGAILICSQVIIIVLAFVIASMAAGERSTPPPERGPGLEEVGQPDPLKPALE